jgi:hypothetical protein
MLGGQFPKVEAMLRDAEPELLAFAAFPVSHWKKIWSTDEIVNPAGGGRRVVVLGPFCPSRWPETSARSRGQGGAPAAQRGRTTLTRARTGVGSGGGGRGSTPS